MKTKKKKIPLNQIIAEIKAEEKERILDIIRFYKIYYEKIKKPCFEEMIEEIENTN